MKARKKAGRLALTKQQHTRISRELEETQKKLLEGSDLADPSLPIYRLESELALESLRQSYEEGEQKALLSAIRICAAQEIPLPAWASKAYIRAYDTVLNCRVASWDDAFGRPFKKGLHLSALRKRRGTRLKVWLAVRQAVERDGRAIDESLFEEVGGALGFGKTLTSELYYEAKRLVSWSFK